MNKSNLTNRLIVEFRNPNDTYTDEGIVLQALSDIRAAIYNSQTSGLLYPNGEWQEEVKWEYDSPTESPQQAHGIVKPDTMQDIHRFLDSLPKGEKHLDYYTAFDEISLQLRQALNLLNQIVKENEQ